MESGYNLLLSPHPDDLVLSGYSAICERREKQAIEFFNVSSFTRWRLKSKLLVTAYRTLEDRVILGLLNVKVSFLFLGDTSVSIEGRHSICLGDLKALLSSSGIPHKLFCPLGIGGHLDHMFVRQSGIDLWQSWGKEPELFFYEDLPYAALDLRSGYSFERCLLDVKHCCGVLRIAWRPLTKIEMRAKLLACRAYASQTNHANLLTEHARVLGKECSADFAERYFVPE